MPDLVRQAMPFIVFAAFLLYFNVRARRDGKTTKQWIDDHNRATFSRRGPRVFFAVCAAFIAAVWIAVAVAWLAGA